MTIRKPALTVSEARKLAEARTGTQIPQEAASERKERTGGPDGTNNSAEPPAATLPPIEAANKALAPLIEGSAKPSRAGGDSLLPSNPKEVVDARPNWNAAVPSSALLFPGQNNDKTQVFISALLPSAGVSPIFETLCRQYPPNRALQMVLRRALQEYEELLQNGSFRSAPESYPIDPKAGAENFVQTSRMMPRILVGIARAHFDPLGLESTRNFGRKLANAALATFFAREKNKH